MNPSYAFKPYQSSIPSFLNSSNREDPSKSKLFIFQTIKPENPFSNFSQTPSRYLFPSAEEESVARNRDFARVWRVGPIASRGHSYALWQREMMDEAEWEGEREKLESGEGAPLERGGGEGRGTGRTGAYGVDPSGATANVSVSVSAGRASGPADIIQEVTSRTCPIIPLPPIGPRRPRRCAFTQGRRNALVRPSARTQVFDVYRYLVYRGRIADFRVPSKVGSSGSLRFQRVTGRWSRIRYTLEKKKKKKGGGCKVELAGFVIPRIFRKWGRNGRLVEIMGHEATSERDEAHRGSVERSPK